MPKTFIQENEVTGYPVKYTILASTKENDDEYIIYTNYIPSDNELGYRLMAGKVINTNPFQVERLRVVKEKEITNEFLTELVRKGLNK